MKNELTYLSIAKEPYSINYALFKGKSLISYGTKSIRNLKYTGNILLEVGNVVENLIKKHKPNLIITNLLDETLYQKPLLIKMVQVKSMIEYVALKHNILYVEFSTYGWEKRLLGSYITQTKKVNLVNKGYLIDLKKEQSPIADAIMLGEGVSHNRLQIGRKYIE